MEDGWNFKCGGRSKPHSGLRLEGRLENHERQFAGVQEMSLPSSWSIWDKGYMSEADVAVWGPSKEAVPPETIAGRRRNRNGEAIWGSSDYGGPHRLPELWLWS